MPDSSRVARRMSAPDRLRVGSSRNSRSTLRPWWVSRGGSGVFIGRNTILSCKNGDIEIADGANIGFNCEVFSASRVTVGKDVLMAAYSYIIGGDHDFSDPSRPVLEQSRTSAGVIFVKYFVCAAWFAHTPAKQSACSSDFTPALPGP